MQKPVRTSTTFRQFCIDLLAEGLLQINDILDHISVDTPFDVFAQKATFVVACQHSVVRIVSIGELHSSVACTYCTLCYTLCVKHIN